jgi:small conductance mechanosensitive channel
MTIDENVLSVARPVAAVLLALVAFPLAHKIARGMKAAALRGASATGADVTIVRFIAEAVRIALLAAALVLVLVLAGVSASSVAAGLAAVLLAIGLALQATLANLAAGIIIVVQRIYRLGQFVQIGSQRGTVKVVSLFTTEIETLTGTTVTIANGEILKQPVVNFSALPGRRVDVEVTLAWDTDSARACTVALEAARAVPGVVAEPEPQAVVARLTAAGPQLAVRAHCATADIARVAAELPGAIHRAVLAAGVRPGEVEAP